MFVLVSLVVRLNIGVEMRNAMVVSVQRAPLLPSSLPGYLSPTEMSRPVLSGHVITLKQSGAGALWSRDHSGPIRGRCSLVTGAPLPPASPPVSCTWCSYGHNNNTRGHMLTLPTQLSGSPTLACSASLIREIKGSVILN